MKKLFIVLCLTAFTGFAAFAEPEQLFNPSNEAKLEYNRGVGFYKMAQYDKSMEAFRRAIEIDPNYIDAYYNLGSILEYLHQDDAALTIFKQIIVRKPDDYESVYKAANLSFKSGNIDSAKSYLSLIPIGNPIYEKAQKLAMSMNTDMQTIKAEAVSAGKKEIFGPNSSEMYNNIPSPTGITTDANGNIFVACFSDNMIYKITPDGKKIIFIKDAKINGPIAMAGDDNGNIYVSNYNSDNVIKISPTGTITILISNIQKPYGIHINSGMLFVSSQGSNAVLKYKL